MGEDRKLPGDFSPKAPAARLYHLERENTAAGLARKVEGYWVGTAACQGDVTFKADGTYFWSYYGPGSATIAGKWAVRWDALPPTLVMTPTASTDKDYLRSAAEVKVLRLDATTLVYEGNKHRTEFAREPKREPKRQDAKLLQGRWKVVTDETHDGTNWNAAEVPADFAFVIADGKVARSRQNQDPVYRLDIDAGCRSLVLTGEAIDGIAEVVRGIYRVTEDRLTICVTNPAKPSTLRLYHLERVK
jgi:uncharacterized protein (TIGR03067 family)